VWRVWLSRLMGFQQVLTQRRGRTAVVDHRGLRLELRPQPHGLPIVQGLSSFADGSVFTGWLRAGGTRRAPGSIRPVVLPSGLIRSPFDGLFSDPGASAANTVDVDKEEWIERHVIDPHLEVHVRAGRPARSTLEPQHLALAHDLAGADM
jgi:hypothetical protein